MSLVKIRKIATSDGEYERNFLLTVPDEENGFFNKASENDLSTLENFRIWVEKKIANSLGIDIKPGYVPSTIYYIELDDRIVGLANIRHYLNEKLIEEAAGHIGIGGIPQEYRGLGIGTKAMKLLIDELVQMGQRDIIVGALENNIASRKMIEHNGGILEKFIPAVYSPGQNMAVYWIHK